MREDSDSRNLPPRTILFAWNYVEWGGVQIYFLGLMRGAGRGFNVKAVLPEKSDKKILAYLEENGIEYEFFEGKIDIAGADDFRRRIMRRWNDFKTNLSLARHFSKMDLHNAVVQIDVAPWAGFVLLLYLTLRTDVFVTFHTAIPEISAFRRLVWKIKFGVLTAFERFHVAASNLDVKKSLRRFVSEARFQQIEVIYSSINADEIERARSANRTRQEIARRYDFPAEKIWVCNVAQFIERKGCRIFLEAAEMLAKNRSDLFFVWLGTAPLNAEMRRLVGEYQLNDTFRFLSAGEIGENRIDLLTLLNATDLFVLPSFQEGLPVALVEAMALGKACVASRVNAIPEAIEDHETGVLVEPGDGRKLAAAIAEIADDPILRKELGEKARRRALENFEEKITGQAMRRLYENVSRTDFRQRVAGNRSKS